MNISKAFIERPIATSLLMAGILLVGLAAYPLLPVAPLPEVDFPTIQVSTSLPGASPETIASSVTQPLERQFGEIPGVTQMTSSSTLGNSAITVQFDLSRNIDGAAQDIQTAINAASGQLPTNLPSPPTYRKVNPADAPILVLALTSDAMPLTQVDDYAENILAQHISQISGVAQVSVSGQQKPAVRIQLDPAKVASLGLSLEDIRSTITTATTDSPKGTIDGPSRTYTIYDNDQELKAEPWNDIVVAYKSGAPVRVRDIGRAVDGPENDKLGAWANGKPAILLPVYKLPGANVIADRRSHQCRHAPAARGDPLGDHDQHPQRPHADHPRLGRRHPVHPDAHHRLGRHGDLRLPAQPLGDGDPERRRAFGARRHLRDHVSAGLQPRQSLLDGPCHRRRLRRRRCDRDAREHPSPYRGRADAEGSRHQGCGRDRLHHHLHQPVARRRLHPAAAHGRDRRAAVSRIRRHRRHDHRRFRRGLADLDPDDVRPVHAGRSGGKAWASLYALGTGVRYPAHRLPPQSRCRPSPPPHHLRRLSRHSGRDRLSLHRHSQRLLSAAGYRPHHRHLGGGPGHLLRRDGPPPARPRRGGEPRIPPSPRSAWRWARAAPRRRTTGASSSP